MKSHNSTSTIGLSKIPQEGAIESGNITYLLTQLTDSDVENSIIDLDEADPKKQSLSILLQNITDGINDKKKVDGVYIIEAGGHFVMMNLQDQDGIIKYKVFDSLSLTENGGKRSELLTNILINNFGSNQISQSESDYVKVQQGADVNSKDTDNCGLLCIFAQLVDEKKLDLGYLSPNDEKYHNLNRTLNSLRGKDIQTIDPEALSQELLGIFTPPHPTKDSPKIVTTENIELKEAISTIFKKYENSEKVGAVKSRPSSDSRASDLIRLENLSQYLSEITSKEEITEELLNKIGEETAEIIVCNASKTDFIRNRYGLIGSKSEFKTKDGVDFKGLQAFRYIQESDLDSSKMDDLFQGLQTTKKKIDFAITEEKGGQRYQSSVKQVRRNMSPPNNWTELSKFTREFYSQFLLDGIERELDLLKNIDSSQPSLKTNDKYVLSRAFAKIGERSKEILDHNNDTQLGQKAPLFHFLKNIRDEVSHTHTTIFIDREMPGKLSKELIDVVCDSLINGVDEQKQNEIDKISENLIRKKSAKSTTDDINPKNDTEQKVKLLIEKSKKHFDLELDVADLPGLKLHKNDIDKPWKDIVSPLEAKRDQAYGMEVIQLEKKLTDLLEQHPKLRGIDNKLAALVKKNGGIKKEIEGIEKKLKQHKDCFLLVEKETLTTGELKKLEKLYNTTDIEEIKSKIETSLKQTTSDMGGKTKILEETKKEEEIKESNEYKSLKHLQKEIRQEKIKSQDTAVEVSNLNAQIRKINDEMGGKSKDIKNQIIEVEEKEKILSNVKVKMWKIIQELDASVTNVDMILDENLFEEINDALIKDQLNRKDSKEAADQKITKEKVSKKMGKIGKELEYMQSIYSDGSLDMDERSYILQHALSIIGQNSRDIEVLEECIISQDSFKNLTKSSLTFSDSWRSNIKTRNKQISHDIDSFDEDLFLSVVKNDTLSISEDIKAIRELIVFDYEESKAQFSENLFDYSFGGIINNIALNHLRLGNHEDARSCFDESLKYFDQSRIVEEFKVNDPIILENGPHGISQISGNNPNLIVFVHNNKDFCSNKSIVLGNLAHLLTREGSWNDALLKFEEAEELDVIAHGCTSKENITNQAFLLRKLDRISEAKDKIRLASDLPGEDISGAVLLNDIIINQDDEDVQETREKLEEMIKWTSDIQTRFSALSHAGFIDAKLDEFDKSKSRIDGMEEYLKHNEGELKNELGNEFIKLKKQLLEAKIGRFGLKFRSENDEMINADFVNEDDIKGLQKLSGEVVRLPVSEDAIRNFACALSNVAVAIRKDHPKTSIDLLKKGLYFQRQYNIDDSITLLQLGGSHYKLAEISDKEKNQEEAMKYLLMAKDHSKKPQTSACINDEIGGILLRRGDYRSALNSFQLSRDQWSEDSMADKVENDIEQCKIGLRIYDSIESALIKSYRSSKNSRMKADGSQFWGLGGIEKEHLTSYLKFELKLNANLTEIEGRPAIQFNKTLAEALEQKLSKNQERSSR